MLFYTIEPKRTDSEANNSWAKLDAKVSTLLISYVFMLFCLTSICPFGFLTMFHISFSLTKASFFTILSSVDQKALENLTVFKNLKSFLIREAYFPTLFWKNSAA